MIARLYEYLSLTIFSCIFGITGVQAQDAYLVEAEDFQFKGGWQVEKPVGHAVSNRTILRVFSGKVKAADALTVINIKTAGTYHVWVRAADYPADRPGTRLFGIAVNEQPLENECGKHGKDGYYWEEAGTITLEEGEAVIALKDTRGNHGRCDAVMLTAEAFNPNTQTLAKLQQFKTTPVQVKSVPGERPVQMAAVKISKDARVIATVNNDHLRLQFLEGVDEKGKQRIAAVTALKKDGQWISINDTKEDNRIFLLRATDPQISFGSFFPSWNGTPAFSSFVSKGKTFRVLESESLKDPFLSGKLMECIPIAVKSIKKNTLEVTYQTADGQTLKGVWQLDNGASHLQLTLKYTAKENGYCSLVVTAFQGMEKEKATNILLPPMFQYQRITDNPVMLPSAMMPQPLSIVETQQGKGLITTFITGTPADFPLDWAMSNTSRMGFAVKNEKNEVQPVALSPVLGLNDSRLAAGASIQREFTVGAVPEGWNNALAYISDSIYKVRDYRTQVNTSLTEAAFNITDLIRNDTAGGWDSALKGFYDIEADPKVTPTVVQAAPLAVIAAAVISRDEEFYISRALPSIEYTLSRSGFRWTRGGKPTPLSPYGSQFTTAYYEGLHQLLGEANPWLKKIALPDNKIRSANGYSVVVPAWTQELAAYRLTKDHKWLDAAKRDADTFLTKEVYGHKTAPLSKQPFYNTSFYANWWDLTDLYDVTKEERYLKAAEASAFHTLAGVRVYPLVKDSLQTIHPGNVYDGNTTLWWKGGRKYRLGFPRQRGDVQEKQVPQSLVSPVGLGFEQPYTFFDPGKLVRHVFMSSWAPHLLRLYEKDKREIFETYARNAVIGRFTNYPGYYATGFTDITMQPGFPYKGPDVSSVYYHHIPPHLAFTMDFLITEAMQRSAGKVSFPYGKQDGFVWFNNRVFGGGKGTIFDDSEVSLWMKKGLIQVDDPGVNYVTAISDNRFWIILLNEGHKTTTCNIKLGAEVPVKDNAGAAVYASAKADPALLNIQNRQLSATLAPKGFSALSLPLSVKGTAKRITPVKDGMRVLDLGPAVGKCYVFRIRSPFGWDAVYAYLETVPAKGTPVTVTINSLEETVNAYPYEWSYHPLDAKDKATVKVQLKVGNKSYEETIVL